MKITPLEIRQKSFEKVFRGYDKDEVDAYLLSLSQQWEKSQDDYKELKYKLQATEREIIKLREVENTLFKTLKTAEDTGANVIEQAKKTADLHLRETQMKVDAMTSDSKNKARALIENAEYKARKIIEDMEDEVKSLEKSYKSLLNHRDNLMADLRNLAGDTLSKIEKIENLKDRYLIDDYVKKSREIEEDVKNFKPAAVEEQTAPATPENNETAPEDQSDGDTDIIPDQEPEESANLAEERGNSEKKPGEGGSFFDSIG